MTATDVSTGSRPVAPRHNGTHDHHAGEPTWADQVVLSGAGLLSQGLERTRSNGEALLDVVDDLVLGGLDVMEELSNVSAQFVTQLASVAGKPLPAARRAYTTGSGALRRAIAEA